MTDIDDVRALLQAKARPVGWAERRARLDEVGTVVPVADDIAVRPDELDGVPVEWSDAPDADATRVLLYFHGGGYCSGSITSHRSLVTEAGRAAGIRTLAVGYRLAPEHPYPAAVDDAVAVWRQLRSAGIAAERIAVAGDSAGAGVSLALWLGGVEAAGCCAFVGGDYLENRYFGEGIGLVTRKEDEVLARALDDALQRLWDEGKYAELYLRFFPVSPF